MKAIEKFEIASKIASSSRYLKKNILYPKSVSGKYIFYRLARPILKLNYKAFKFSNPITPWTTQASIRIFETLLNNSMIGFEYGSGKSSIFIAKKIKHLTSVEHNEKWFTHIKETFKNLGITNVDYHFIPPKPGKSSIQYSFKQDYNLMEDSFEIMTDYHDYFSLIKNYPDEHFDFILIDGRARVECALNGIPKLKQDGMFVLDNSDRARYQPIFEVLEKWPRVTTTTGLFDTTIWFKP